MRGFDLVLRAAFALPVLTLGLRCSVRASPPADDPLAQLDCRKAVVQMELNACADREFRSWDAKLDALYRKAMAAADGKERALLKAAETNWLSYRDSECALEAAASEGGSIAPMEYAECRTEKTRARIEELRRQGD